MFSEKQVAFPVVRAEPFNLTPVAIGVIEFDPVSELVNDNIVDDRFRPADEPPGEIQPSLPAARSPSSAGAINPNMVIGQSELFCGLGNFFPEKFGSEFPVELFQLRPNGGFVPGRDKKRPVEGQQPSGEAERIQRSEIVKFFAIVEFWNRPVRFSLVELSEKTLDPFAILRNDVLNFGDRGALRSAYLQTSVFWTDEEGESSSARRTSDDDWRKIQFCSLVSIG